MHEYSIVAALIHRVQDEVAARGGSFVHRLEVKIGEQAGVEIELLRTAYETFRTATVCDGAALEIEMVPVQWECATCGVPIATGEPLRCRRCQRPARLAAGDEIVLARIEMEAPDV